MSERRSLFRLELIRYHLGGAVLLNLELQLVEAHVIRDDVPTSVSQLRKPGIRVAEAFGGTERGFHDPEDVARNHCALQRLDEAVGGQVRPRFLRDPDE